MRVEPCVSIVAVPDSTTSVTPTKTDPPGNFLIAFESISIRAKTPPELTPSANVAVADLTSGWLLY